MKALIAGAGIGGLSAALCLHRVGIDVEIFERSDQIRELGVGINMLPHAVRELAELGLMAELDRAGIRTRELIYAMAIAGGNAAKFVFYPIAAEAGEPDTRLTNWAVMAKTAETGTLPARREDWSRSGIMDEVLPFVRDRFRLDFVDPAAIIEATGTFYEHPNCDRDPLPGWSFGRVTLLGDAAHPMYPVGSNGASQAILDARSLATHLASEGGIETALARYDAERRPATAGIVLANRRGGPEGVIDMVEARAPHGFDDIDAVAPFEERKAVVNGYASLAGFAKR